MKDYLVKVQFWIGLPVYLLLFGCLEKTTEKRIVSFCSNDYIQLSNSGLKGLVEMNDSHSWENEPRDSISVKAWRILMDKFEVYSKRTPIGSVSYPHSGNFCRHSQTVFYEDDISKRYICISDELKQISFNSYVYNISQGELDEIRALLKIGCPFDPMIFDDLSGYYRRRDIKVIEE